MSHPGRDLNESSEILKNELHVPWVFCFAGNGLKLGSDGQPNRDNKGFRHNTVGILECFVRDRSSFQIRMVDGNRWLVPHAEVESFNPLATGDNHSQKICKHCHCLLPIKEFTRDRYNKAGVTRRSGCKKCSKDLKGRPLDREQAKMAEHRQPKTGSIFACPLCGSGFIVQVTSRVVRDHDHESGNFRDFICERCNTGLGQFRNGRPYIKKASEYLAKHKRKKRKPQS